MAIPEKERALFEDAPIPRAVRVLAVPTVITQLISIFYNYADTWFVGRTGNPAMVACTGIVFPIYVIMAAVANLFGIGASSVISRSLGMRNEIRARRAFTFAFWGGLGSAVVYALLMLAFRSRLIWIIGGDENSAPYVYQYIFWTMILGAVPSVGNVLCGHLVRSVGASKEAGIGMSLGGILNVVLDPLFMFVILPEGHEIQGAAIATMLSNIAAFSYFLIYLRRHHAEHPVFDTDPRHLTLQDHVARDVITVGLPAALQTTFAMLSNIFANQLIKPYGSEAVAGMGVAKKINTFAFNSCMGLTQGILPLLGYSYGARNYQRMRKTIRFSGTIVFLFGCACTILFRTFADPLCRFFIDEAESVRYGTLFLRVIAFAAPLASLSYLMGTVFQASGHRAQAFVLSTMRKGFLDIPAMFLFSYALGLGAEGVVWATPFAEIVSAAIAVILYRRFLRSLPAVPSDPS